MSTKNSPLSVIKMQADNIAKMIKAAERGEMISAQFFEKISRARSRDGGKGSFKVGIAMDDKIITVDIPWATIRDTDEAALSEYIVGLMREENRNIQ